MDKTLKEKWIAALRSGEYSQAQGTLKDEAGNYCCLGVLCKMEGTLEEYVVDNSRSMYEVDLSEAHATDLGLKEVIPKEASKLHPKFDRSHFWKALVALNDNGVSFDRIADFVEEYL